MHYLITDQRKLSVFKRSPQLLLDPTRSFGHIVWSAKDFQTYFPAEPKIAPDWSKGKICEKEDLCGDIVKHDRKTRKTHSNWSRLRCC